MAEKKEANAKEKEVREKEPEKKLADSGETNAVTAHKHVIRYMWWAMGAGAIPVPFVDLGALAGVQLKMLHRLSQHYEVEFSQNRGKSIIATLIGTITTDSLHRSAFTSFVKSIPFVGFIGVVSMPIYAGAATYAIGKLFIQHFESGGTFLDFDPKKVKDYFAKLYEEGKSTASKLKPKKA